MACGPRVAARFRDSGKQGAGLCGLEGSRPLGSKFRAYHNLQQATLSSGRLCNKGEKV